MCNLSNRLLSTSDNGQKEVDFTRQGLGAQPIIDAAV